jgi:hypothetical protein
VHHDGTVEVRVLSWRVFALRGEGTLDGPSVELKHSAPVLFKGYRRGERLSRMSLRGPSACRARTFFPSVRNASAARSTFIACEGVSKTKFLCGELAARCAEGRAFAGRDTRQGHWEFPSRVAQPMFAGPALRAGTGPLEGVAEDALFAAGARGRLSPAKLKSWGSAYLQLKS